MKLALGDSELNEKTELTTIEIKVLAELMKNSRRSDRQIARAIGVSQPTVSRIISRLEKKGAIKEYTVIPDFRMLGYNILGMSRLNVSEASKPELNSVRTNALQMEKDNPNAFLMALNGLAGNKNRVFMVLYQTYSDYINVKRIVENASFVDVASVDTFLADLNDETNMRTLSMASVANHILYRLEKEEKSAHAQA